MFGLYFWLFLFGFNYILSYLACLSWLLFFCCHRLVLITTFQNMRSSMLSFGNHVGNELYALKIVVLNARVSIGFTLEEFFNSLFCNFAVHGVFLKKKSQSWLVYCRWNFLLGAWQGWWWGFIWWSPLSFSYPSVFVTLTIPTLWVQFLVVLILSNSYSVCFF